MKKFKKFLVPLDGTKDSLKGLEEATALAKQCNASITGIYVIDFLNDSGLNVLSSEESELAEKASLFLEKAKTLCVKNKIKFTGIVEHGEKGPKIVSFARNYKFDLILMGTRGKSKARELFFGSVSNPIIHKSKTPLLLLR